MRVKLERFSRSLSACAVVVAMAPLDVQLGERFVGLRQTKPQSARLAYICMHMHLHANKLLLQSILLTARCSTDIERHRRPIARAMSPKG